jgi:hypothetical protein
MTTYPIGYGTERVTLGELKARHAPNMHPEFARRLFAWIESENGLIGIGSGYRSTAYQMKLWLSNPRRYARPGNSFHEPHVWASGIEAYAAVDLVAGTTGSHRSPTWAEGESAKPYGVHTFIDGEPWHMQLVETRSCSAWKKAGRPDPKIIQLPGQEADDMKALVIPERAYDSRSGAQHNVEPGLAAANAKVPKTRFAAGETRKIVVGFCTEAFVHVTMVATKPGYLTISGSTQQSSASIVNADADGVVSDGCPIATPEGAVYITASAGDCDVIVDVFARG